ncbi:SET domain-containing protein 9 [Pogona vitticeps]|uniref:SET domain-containing protein 9 n=1 Tax=Pogona vitticeps TaxID=103695 RepID=A0A6J0UKK2_9SAUR
MTEEWGFLYLPSHGSFIYTPLGEEPGVCESHTPSPPAIRRVAFPWESFVMLRALRRRWESYKYRFVPWIALNLRHKRRTLRFVSEESKDKTVSDEDVLQTLLKTFRALFVNNLNRQTLLLNFLPEIKSKYPELQSDQCEIAKAMNDKQQRHILNPEEVLFNTLGFSITRRHSSLVSAGTGVFVSKGFVPKGTVVSMYPGTIYEKYEPILFQSIGNPFIFRCADGVLIDGNDKGISKAIYRSCSKRDQFGPLKTSDVFWLTSDTQNPLAVGQYVNNCSRDKAANVCYQEFDVPKCFPIEFMQYLPNTKYSHEVQRPLRCVVLVALQNIGPGEELFSNYYTIIC